MIKDILKHSRPLAIKKGFSILIILFGMLFVLLNRGLYYSDHISSVRLKAENPEDETWKQDI